MTLVAKVQTPGDRWHYLYYLLAPASGANNVVITAASSHYLISEASSWYNIAQSGQPGPFSTNTSPTNASVLASSLAASSNTAIVAESMWAPMQILPSYGSSEVTVDSAFQSLGMFSSVPSPVTQAFLVYDERLGRAVFRFEHYGLIHARVKRNCRDNLRQLERWGK